MSHDSSYQFSDCNNCHGNDDCRELADKTDKSQIQGKTIPECAVCLQQCIHPACLPCNHVFCYLCVKGVANQSKRCPMCRQEIPADFLEHPQLLELDRSQHVEEVTQTDDNADISTQQEFQWFYEGRNGWWQYDQRTNVELETAYKQRKQTCELLIAGFLYIADFTTMFQVRRNDHSRRRRIKRDLCNAPKKGIAGLRLNNPTVRALSSEQTSAQIANLNYGNNGQNSNVSLPTPTSNVENNALGEERNSTAAAVSEHHGQTNSLHQVLEQMRSVVLRSNITSTDEQSLLNSNENGSVLDNASLSWSHQTPSNAINTSEEEQT